MKNAHTQTHKRTGYGSSVIYGTSLLDVPDNFTYRQ